jgi:hypothetical protein
MHIHKDLQDLREIKYAGKIFIEKSHGKMPLVRLRCWWEDIDAFTAIIRVFICWISYTTASTKIP